MPRGCMKAPSQRQLRIGEEIRHMLANLLERGDIRDPDVAGKVITVAGNGSTVGDLAVAASTSDTANTSVYAFAHTGDASELELVAINKNAATTSVRIAISNAASFTTVTAYNLVDGNPAVVAVSTNPSVSCSGGKCSLTYAMPATSATTLVLR